MGREAAVAFPRLPEEEEKKSLTSERMEIFGKKKKNPQQPGRWMEMWAEEPQRDLVALEPWKQGRPCPGKRRQDQESQFFMRSPASQPSKLKIKTRDRGKAERAEAVA